MKSEGGHGFYAHQTEVVLWYRIRMLGGHKQRAHPTSLTPHLRNMPHLSDNIVFLYELVLFLYSKGNRASILSES